MVQIGFSQVFSSLVELFGVIYTSGTLIFQWLSTPLTETVGDGSVIIGDLAVYTPFELMFGPSLILILILALVRFFLVT